ncbi:MAG: iron-siderophore ABC transporter substrate-binding protein [Egibacteraceae bacterium]
MTTACLDPVDELTRRRFLTGAGVLGVLTVLPTSASGQEAGGAATSDAFPVTVEHKFGSTEVTEEPARVVVVGVIEQEPMLALGVVPVATTRFRPDVYPGEIYPWAQDELGDAEPPQAVEYTDGYQFEQIAALRPDLILGLYSPMSQEDYDVLAQIAPTVAQPVEYPDFGVPWQEMTRIVGRLLGRAAPAEELVAGVEMRFAQERAEHPEFEGETALLVYPQEDGTYFLYGPQDTRARILSSLGFAPPDGLDEVAGDGYGGSISTETPELLDVGALVLFAEPEIRAELHADPLYSGLAVKTEGREVFIGAEDPLDIPMGGFITVLSLPFLLDRLVPRLAAAVDGDPATEVPAPAG